MLTSYRLLVLSLLVCGYACEALWVMQAPLSSSSSRRQFLTTSISSAAVTASAWQLSQHPAAADSTGKFSTKATAKKRYLPRIREGVVAWNAAKSSHDYKAFTSDILPELYTALNLYGSSLKKGEYPDAKSKALQGLASEFQAQVQLLDKAARSGQADAVARYMSAADEALKAYIVKAEVNEGS